MVWLGVTSLEVLTDVSKGMLACHLCENPSEWLFGSLDSHVDFAVVVYCRLAQNPSRWVSCSRNWLQRLCSGYARPHKLQHLLFAWSPLEHGVSSWSQDGHNPLGIQPTAVATAAVSRGQSPLSKCVSPQAA